MIQTGSNLAWRPFANEDPLMRITYILLITLFCVAEGVANANAIDLKSGGWQLSVSPHESIRFSDGPNSAAAIDDPLAVNLIDASGKITHITGRYEQVMADEANCIATGSITTANQSILGFSDKISALPDRGAFLLVRSVTVRDANSADAGFGSELEIRSSHARRVDDVQPFIPGMWYCDASHVPSSGMISDSSQRDYLFREDRLPIPMAMFREKDSGVCLSIVHDQPDGASFKEENSDRTVIDDRMKFASLGLRQRDGLGVVLDYPGCEGDQSRVGDARRRRRRCERFHPVKAGFVQGYRVIIHLSKEPNFDAAMNNAWRMGFDAMNPPIVSVKIDRVYSASISVLDHYGQDHHGIPGFPFSVNLPDGSVRDVSYQMGFVGEQIPCAYHLITAGFSMKRPELVAKGERIVDFWAGNCLSSQGVPRTWYDVDPQPHWRDYKTFTRIATDGMEGMLQAWRRMQLNHHDKPVWLKCCRTYADWLVAHQNSDGSFCRQYDFEGKVVIASKSATLHPVRFLIDMSRAIGDTRYLNAARKAGDFALIDIGDNANYYGGTADNDDVKDKEAGWIAFDSFLALYEATDDHKWLAAADRAALFTETWTYCWNVPIPRDDPKVTVPGVQTTAGVGLIAIGHSGADVFLAFGPYAYYRLSIYNHDPHDAAMAKLLMNNIRQFVDVDGSLHYGQSGLVTEAFSLEPPRGHGVGQWLPWCSAAMLDPMQQLQDVFGLMDLDEIEKIPISERERLLKLFLQSRGVNNNRQ